MCYYPKVIWPEQIFTRKVKRIQVEECSILVEQYSTHVEEYSEYVSRRVRVHFTS